MPVFADQTGKMLVFAGTPSRIISLVPSQTELLYDLGLDSEVVGITKFCIHPESWFRTKTRVGGTKQLNMEIIHSLQPDLIIANKEENVKEQVQQLAERYAVWTSDIHDLPSAYHMIEQVGKITGKPEAALGLVSRIQENFAQLKTINSSLRDTNEKLKTVYLIWQKPYMTIGGDTFIHTMLQEAGFNNIFSGEKRYPEITIELLKQKQPDVLLLSSEPFPFKPEHASALQDQLPGAKVLLVDGEMFSWYGSRLEHAADYFSTLRRQLEIK
jgi:ABC-type Fe3+-hydroxamate transport system substrate-binding protein